MSAELQACFNTLATVRRKAFTAKKGQRSYWVKHYRRLKLLLNNIAGRI